MIKTVYTVCLFASAVSCHTLGYQNYGGDTSYIWIIMQNIKLAVKNLSILSLAPMKYVTLRGLAGWLPTLPVIPGHIRKATFCKTEFCFLVYRCIFYHVPEHVSFEMYTLLGFYAAQNCTILCCIQSSKSMNLIYTAVEA